MWWWNILYLMLSLLSLPLIQLLYYTIKYQTMKKKFTHIPRGSLHNFPLQQWMEPRGGIDQILTENLNENGVREPLLHYGPNFDGSVWLVTSDVQIAKYVLTHYDEFPRYGASYSPLTGIVGDGMFSHVGEAFRHKQKAVKPLFHGSTIDQLSEGSLLAARAFVDDMKEMSGEVVDSTVFFKKIMVYNAINIVFGEDRYIDKDHLYLVWMRMLESPRRYIALQQIFQWFRYLPLPEATLIRKNTEHIRQYFLDIVKRRRQQIESGQKEPNLTTLIDRLITYRFDDNKGYTDEVIVDELRTFMLAGHSSGAKAMGWTCYFLGKNPEVQKKVHEELDRVVGDRDVTFDDLNQLTYLTQVIKEAMRIRPANLLDRYVSRDTQIGPHFIPKGACLSVWVMGVHYDPTYWPEPDQFNPDRFAPENEIEPFSFLPFSAGSRNCIGQKYGMIEVLTGLAALLNRYTADSSTSADEIGIDLNGSCKDITLQFHPRK